MRRSFLAVTLMFGSSLFAQDKAALDKDIRAAMPHVGFHDQAFTLEAEFTLPNAPNGYQGKYQLRWKSPEQWFDRVDFGPFAFIRIGQESKMLTKDNVGKPIYAEIRAHDAFGPPYQWFDGSEWRIKSAKSKKLEAVKAACATYEGPASPTTHTNRELEICIDPESKDILKVGSTLYSDFTIVEGHRYPQKIEIREGDEQSLRFSASVKRISNSAEVPAPPVGVREQLNCTQAIREPKLNSKVVPEYPMMARREHQQGTVALVAVIESNGSVTIHGVGQSAGKLLDESAIDAVRRWKYLPATCGSSPLPSETIITVHYFLAGN